MELIIENEEMNVPAISFGNYEAIVAELKPKLDDYKNLIVQKDDLTKAKLDRASLNKLAKAINDKKIEIKKKCLEPCAVFEEQAKGIMAMINEASSAIDGQIKRIEDEEKEERKAELEEYYIAASPQKVSSNIPFDGILISTWLNKTANKNATLKAIDEAVDKLESDINLIEEIGGDFQEEILAVYRQTFSLTDALREANRMKGIKEKIVSTLPKEKSKETTSRMIEL